MLEPKTRLRVLHVVNGEHYSGAESVQDLLALCLPQYGFDVGFVCLKPDRFPISRLSSSPLFTVPMRSKLDWSAGKKIAKIAREGEYNILHAHTPRAALVSSMAARSAGLPMAYHVHSPARFDSADRLRNWTNAVSEKISLKKTAAYITVSEKLAAYMKQEGFPMNRIHVVPNGVPKKSGLLPWSQPQGRAWELGMVALYRPRKGLEVLLEALSQLRDKGLLVHFTAVGPFETKAYEMEIHSRVRALQLEDAIRWVGYTKHVEEAFAQMDIFVIPSLFGEGLPMVLLEAMAAGIPIVAAEVDGIAQAVRHGTDGVLFKAGDAGALSLALQALMEGKYAVHALRENAKKRQEEEFSDTGMAMAVAKIYHRMLAA